LCRPLSLRRPSLQTPAPPLWALALFVS
jgi:hypothetical protein